MSNTGQNFVIGGGGGTAKPVRDHRGLSVETTMRSIDPRADKDTVLMIVARALDNCDPGETPTVQITRWPLESS